jgi:hypothetical protein
LGRRIDRSMQHGILSSVVYVFRYTIDAELHVNAFCLPATTFDRVEACL